MSPEAFENHAKKLEQEDFEDDVRSLNASLYQLVTARTHTIRRLRESADYLDSIWFRYVFCGVKYVRKSRKVIKSWVAINPFR